MVKAFDLLDTELNTITIPYADEHNELENLDTDFEDLVKNCLQYKGEAGTMAIQYKPKMSQ